MVLRRASRIFNECGRRCSSVMGQNTSKREEESGAQFAMIEDRGIFFY